MFVFSGSAICGEPATAKPPSVIASCIIAAFKRLICANPAPTILWVTVALSAKAPLVPIALCEYKAARGILNIWAILFGVLRIQPPYFLGAQLAACRYAHPLCNKDNYNNYYIIKYSLSARATRSDEQHGIDIILLVGGLAKISLCN